jgi:hypothetical protein
MRVTYAISMINKKAQNQYDDPLLLNSPEGVQIAEGAHIAEYGTTPVVPIPTGLSDEEDAHRQLALQFGDVLFCRNCEHYYERATALPDGGKHVQIAHCPYCADLMFPVGTKPREKKYR